MKISCIIIEDEQIAQDIITGYIKDVTSLELKAVCNNAMEAMDIVKNSNIELIFLDIEMPKISGLNFIKITNNIPSVIVTTAHREYALQGYDLNVIDYLLKPFSFERFLKAINKFKDYNCKPSWNAKKDFTYLKAERQMKKIVYDDLIFIEGLSNYAKLVLTNKKLIVYESLSSISEKLLPPFFLRVHKSYIVNMTKVDAYTKEYLIVDKKHIPLGNSYRQIILDFLKAK